MLRYAYNTNGLTSHRLDDALALLADCGYDGVALTLDVGHLDPFAPDLPARVAALRRRLDGLGLGSVVETGARFVLDPRRKHRPTLIDADAEDRDRRLAFLRTCVDVAAELGSEAVSFWAGVPEPGEDAEDRLGGPAWFDREAARRRVGPLYPLYREPGRHVVAQVLDKREVR